MGKKKNKLARQIEEIVQESVLVSKIQLMDKLNIIEKQTKPNKLVKFTDMLKLVGVAAIILALFSGLLEFDEKLVAILAQLL